MALIDKPTDALGVQSAKPLPVVAAVDLEEHRKVPAVRDRLARVAALVDARRKGRQGESTPAS